MPWQRKNNGPAFCNTVLAPAGPGRLPAGQAVPLAHLPAAQELEKQLVQCIHSFVEGNISRLQLLFLGQYRPHFTQLGDQGNIMGDRANQKEPQSKWCHQIDEAVGNE